MKDVSNVISVIFFSNYTLKLDSFNMEKMQHLVMMITIRKTSKTEDQVHQINAYSMDGKQKRDNLLPFMKKKTIF